MGNPLQSSTPPPAPEQLQGNPLQQGGGSPGAPAQGQPQAPPQLSHAEAVAALRHFNAIQDELEGLLKNPNLGKSDVKSAIIDGTTKLVASKIMTPAVAVSRLATVPERPFDQRKWVEQHYQTTMAAQSAVLDHHRASQPGSQDWAQEAQQPAGNPDNHIETMAGVMERYRPTNA